jgi:hypothetical protein
MKIIMAIGNVESVCCEVPDKYLENIPGYSDRQNQEPAKRSSPCMLNKQSASIKGLSISAAM